MPAVSISPTPKLQFFNAAGAPLAGGKVYTYTAGTSTPYPSYTDFNGTVANANPVTLDSRGEASIWLEQGVAYKFEVRDAALNLIYVQDGINYSGLANISQTFANGTAASPSVRFTQATTSGLYSPASNQVAIASNGAQAMLFDASQNVGVGGTPTTRFDVFGGARVQGQLTVTTGGVTISAGGLTVTTGGATIGGTVNLTGATTVTGNMTVASGTFASRGFADNATTASWQIDSSGRLRNNGNTQISFAARRITSDQTTSGALIFQDVSFAGGHNDGSAYNVATGIFTVPAGQGGSYLVCANGEAYNTGSVADWTIDLRVNASAILTQVKRTDANVTDGWAFAVILKLSAGDTVNLNATPLSASLYVRVNSSFSIRQIG